MVLFSFENSITRIKRTITKARNERASNFVDKGSISIGKRYIE